MQIRGLSLGVAFLADAFERVVNRSRKESAGREVCGPAAELPDSPDGVSRRKVVTEHMQSLTAACEQHKQAQGTNFVAWQKSTADVAESGEPSKEFKPVLLRIVKLTEFRRNKSSSS